MKNPTIAVTTLSPQKIRDLTVKDPRLQTPHLAAASSLIIHNSIGFVVADDEHHLGVFSLHDHNKPLSLWELFPGGLPEEPKARKKWKPDLEALLSLTSPDSPGQQMLAVPSGSRKNRRRGSLITVALDGTPRVQDLDFGPLFTTLRRSIPDLNIEGALELTDQMWLLHRGNQSTSPNHIIVLKRKKFQKVLNGKNEDKQRLVLKPSLLKKSFELNLGRLDGLRLTVTDGTLVDHGVVLLSAAAEDTDSAYDDGKIKGSALVRLHPQNHHPTHVFILKPRLKVEGIAFDPLTKSLWMVTDHDNRSAAAGLWHLPMSQLQP